MAEQTPHGSSLWSEILIFPESILGCLEPLLRVRGSAMINWECSWECLSLKTPGHTVTSHVKINRPLPVSQHSICRVFYCPTNSWRPRIWPEVVMQSTIKSTGFGLLTWGWWVLWGMAGSPWDSFLFVQPLWEKAWDLCLSPHCLHPPWPWCSCHFAFFGMEFHHPCLEGCTPSIHLEEPSQIQNT